MNACDRTRELLAEHLDGLLPREERTEVERHLVGCADCASAREDFEAVLAEYRAHPIAVVGPELAARVRGVALEATRRPRPGPRAASRLGLLAAAAGVLALLWIGFDTSEFERARRAALAQEREGRAAEAFETLERAYGLAPDERRRAAVLDDQGRLQLALGHSELARELWLERAETLERLGERRLAVEALERVGRELGDPEAAERALRLAGQPDPNVRRQLGYLGYIE